MSELCAFIYSACIRYSYGLCSRDPPALSQPPFLTLSPFSALSLICHSSSFFYFPVILLSLSASISISSNLYFFIFSSLLFKSSFFSIYISNLSANIHSPYFLPSIIPSSRSILPSLLFIAAPSRIHMLFFSCAICNFACCVNGFLFPHPKALSSLRSSIGVLFVFSARNYISVSLSYFLGGVTQGCPYQVEVPYFFSLHPLPVLIYSHAESRDRQIETRRNGREVWKEEVSGEVQMTISDIPLLVNWVWKSNQRVNRLFITPEVEYFTFTCFCSGINVEHTIS